MFHCPAEPHGIIGIRAAKKRSWPSGCLGSHSVCRFTRIVGIWALREPFCAPFHEDRCHLAASAATLCAISRGSWPSQRCEHRVGDGAYDFPVPLVFLQCFRSLCQSCTQFIEWNFAAPLRPGCGGQNSNQLNENPGPTPFTVIKNKGSPQPSLQRESFLASPHE